MDLVKVIEEARQGNKEAFGLLYSAYRLKMKGVCIKILKEEKDDVDDIVHDAFVLAFTSLDKLKNPEKFGQWLTTIVSNVSFKYLERGNKVNTIRLADVSEEELNITENRDFNENVFVSIEDLMSVIDKLPDGYRTVFKLSVIKGLSHREIANLLGIEPHSSSSQLSRAKIMLRKLLSGYMVLVLLVVAISFMVYRYFAYKPFQEKNVATVKKGIRHTDGVSVAQNESIRYNNSEEIKNETEIKKPTEILRPAFTYFNLADVVGKDTGYIEEPCICDSVVVDTALMSKPIPDIEAIVGYKLNKKREWKMLFAGSLGPALAQNVYKLVAGDGNDASVDIDGPVAPVNISTWEGYYDYLLSKSHDDMPADSAALLNIAKNNSGDIVERENHEKPITFGLSLSKAINERWSVETGLQYSLLRSTFTMGSGMNYIQKSQRLHYIGIPVKVSYRIVDYRRLSAYGSVGVVMNIPVKGKVTQCLVTDTISMNIDNWRVSPSLQWSVNASLGVQYELTRNMSIYLEPTLNYQIPAGSHIHSVWTERPFTFTMPVGIRFTW